uniref:AT12662p n=1 Tax=Drosophila melanogaster TaxID=7227 RepID=Q8IHD3_DROME|nr:AT12662p [Drosophila melanogaster]
MLDVGGEGCERLRSRAKCLGWMEPVAVVGDVMLTSGTQRAVTLYRLPLPTATPTLTPTPTPTLPLERISHKSLASRFLILFRLMWFVVVAMVDCWMFAISDGCCILLWLLMLQMLLLCSWVVFVCDA